MTTRTITLGDFEVVIAEFKATWNADLGRYEHETVPAQYKGGWEVGGDTTRTFKSVAGAIRSLRKQVTVDRAGWKGDEVFFILATHYNASTASKAHSDVGIYCK